MGRKEINQFNNSSAVTTSFGDFTVDDVSAGFCWRWSFSALLSKLYHTVYSNLLPLAAAQKVVSEFTINTLETVTVRCVCVCIYTCVFISTLQPYLV